MPRQPPEFGRPREHRGQPAGEQVGEGVLAVGDAAEAPDDPRGDAERRAAARAGRGIGDFGVLTRAQPVHDVGDAETDGDRERDAGEAAAQPQPVVQRVRPDLGAAQQRAPPRPVAPSRHAPGGRAPRSGSSARGGNARSTASPSGHGRGSRPRSSPCAGRPATSTRRRGTGPWPRARPARRPQQVVQARWPARSPGPGRVRCARTRDGANVPGAIAAATTSPDVGRAARRCRAAPAPPSAPHAADVATAGPCGSSSR